MALSGVHIACCNINVANGASLVGTVAWSQTMASAGTTDSTAPGGANQSFEVRASLDVYVAVGAAPNAAAGPRLFIPASETRNIICSPGDKLAWIAA